MEKTHVFNAVGDKLKFAGRAVLPTAIGALVTQVILRMNNGTRTPQVRGGWTEIDISELQAHKVAIAPVIPLHPPVVASTSSEQRRVIGIEDIPDH